MAQFGQREDLYNVTVIVAGTKPGPSGGNKCKFTFDQFSGGSKTSKEVKYRPANGTNDQLSLGGANEVGNVTVKTLLTEAIYQWVPWLMDQVGKADMWVNKQPLDTDGAPYGKALAYVGKLQEVMAPESNSESDTPSLITLTQSTVTVSSA